MTVTTADDGTLDPAPQVTPGAHTEYRLRHPDTAFIAAGISPTVTVLVGVRLTARLSRTSMALGRTATFSGQVIPAHHGQRIRLQHQQDRTWRTVQAKTLPATGRYSFAVRPRATGTSRWRIHKASDSDHIGAISPALRLVVYRAAITGIHADAAGDDRRNLNGEYALIRNTGAAAINLAGWNLNAGDRGQRFSLPRYPLKKGATVRIHTGRGITRAGHLFLGSGRPIWNNDGDSATLIDPQQRRCEPLPLLSHPGCTSRQPAQPRAVAHLRCTALLGRLRVERKANGDASSVLANARLVDGSTAWWVT
jgi:hypothetical protein